MRCLFSCPEVFANFPTSCDALTWQADYPGAVVIPKNRKTEIQSPPLPPEENCAPKCFSRNAIPMGAVLTPVLFISPISR